MPTPEPHSSALQANLRLLEQTCPVTAGLLRAATPSSDLVWQQADDGRWSAQAQGRWLASRRGPWEEALRFASGLEPREVGAAVITGFGIGHHVEAVCERMGKGGVVVCYEPDVALLRAVMERIDFTPWLAKSNLAILTDPADGAAISTTLRGVEGVVSLGVHLMHHQPSQPRLGAGAGQFCEMFTGVVSALRTTVITTLMQTETTLRNLLANADWYASCPGVGDLVDSASGRPAVVVSAGPSLRRNMELLGEPGVRDRVVIIAVQTVLKTLLDAGIKPHYVVAVDYHEISRRYYEGLTERDVQGVTLICDPKANPAIPEAFPGAVRMAHDSILQTALDKACAHDQASMPPGATVAHLAYTTARIMGCDPVILIGQDLGFSDGLYYGPRAAIHDVWAPELNAFRSLEMFEWERIARGRRHSRRLSDVHGRSIYTDEQMQSYLLHFERMFAEDTAKGLRVIDATEGGVAKRHTQAASLRDALTNAIDKTQPAWTPPPVARNDSARTEAAQRLAAHYESLLKQVREVAQISRTTAELLDQMADAKGNQRVIGPLVDRVHEFGRKVVTLEPGYGLVQYLNQTGTLKRFKADREMHYEPELTDLERQARQIERDRTNVLWLADAADQLADLLSSSAEAMRSGRKPTADPREQADSAERMGAASVEVREQPKLAAVIAVDPDSNTLGKPRDLSQPYAGGPNPLRRTLLRLAASEKINKAILLTEYPDRVRMIVGEPIAGLDVEIEKTPEHPLGSKRTMVANARRFCPASWRGGLGGASVFDEIVSAPALLNAMQRHDLGAAVVVGDDWAAIDPELIDACVERHLQYPSRHRLVFTQAVPGLGPVVLERSLVEEMAPHEGRERLWTSVAGLLNYTPVAPIPDPIAKASCVRTDVVLRDVPIRCTANGSWHSDELADALRDPMRPTIKIAHALNEIRWARRTRPLDVTVELCTGRLVGGLGAMTRLGRSDPPERVPMSMALASRLVRELSECSPDARLTLAGAGDPLLHRGWLKIAREAIDAGLALHVRTDLLSDGAVDELMELGPQVVSVDVYADDPAAYAAVAGINHFDRVTTALRRLIEWRNAERPEMWIAPRITRCDAVLDQIEGFYDRWMLEAGACVIDRPFSAVGERRVVPLPLPRLTQLQRAAWSLHIRSDGTALRNGNGAEINVSSIALMHAWTQLRKHKRPTQVAA